MHTYSWVRVRVRVRVRGRVRIRVRGRVRARVRVAPRHPALACLPLRSAALVEVVLPLVALRHVALRPQLVVEQALRASDRAAVVRQGVRVAPLGRADLLLLALAAKLG